MFVVGKKFGVTRERIRQLQNVALDKLRRALRKEEPQQAAPRPPKGRGSAMGSVGSRSPQHLVVIA